MADLESIETKLWLALEGKVPEKNRLGLTRRCAPILLEVLEEELLAAKVSYWDEWNATKNAS